MSNVNSIFLLMLPFAACVAIGYAIFIYRNKSDLASLRDEMTAAATTLQQKDELLAGLNHELQVQKLLIKETDQIRQLAEQQYAESRATIQGLNTRIEERDSRITTLTRDVERERLSATDLQKQSNDFREKAKAYQVSAEKLQLDVDDHKRIIKERELALAALNERHGSLSDEYTQLKTMLEERQASFDEQKITFEHSKQQLKTEFQNLANQILEEKGKTFSENSQSSLDLLLKPFREQIDGFQKRVNEVHSETIKGNATLESEIKKILDVGVKMSADASNLTSVLKGDKKTAGNWGEAQLERTLQLSGLMRGDHYEFQERFKDAEGNNSYPDFVIKLPDQKHIIIDSKVSLIDYDLAISAETELESQQALSNHVKAVRNHIDNLSGKDYTSLIGVRSPSFVLMFMPIEPAYIEAMKHNKDLFNYGYAKNVIMVSHTTLMPILRTVANLWAVERSNAEAREISERAGDIYNQVCVVAENLSKLGNTLTTVSNHYNKTVVSLAGKQGLHGKVERFNALSVKVSKTMPVLEPLHADFEHERLSLIAEPVFDQPAALATPASENTPVPID